MAENIAEVVGLEKITFDTTKADGQFKKTMGNALLKSKLRNYQFTELKEGLRKTIENFKNERRLWSEYYLNNNINIT